jgi:hypothetical protein
MPQSRWIHHAALAAALGGGALAFFAIALWGYDPQRGMARRPARG